MQRAKEIPEALRRRVVTHRHPGVFRGGGQLRHRARVHVPGLAEVSGAEVEAHDGMAHRPVPAIVNVEPGEQRLVALEQLLEGVEEQALPEAPRARQEVVLALVQQPRDEARLVDVVAVLLAELAEGLQADGEAAPDRHRRFSVAHARSSKRANGLPRQAGGATRPTAVDPARSHAFCPEPEPCPGRAKDAAGPPLDVKAT